MANQVIQTCDICRENKDNKLKKHKWIICMAGIASAMKAAGKDVMLLPILPMHRGFGSE